RVRSGPVAIDEHGNRRGSRQQLTQEPNLLRPKFRREEADTDDVATGPVEASDEAVLDGVAPRHEDDRHRRGCSLSRERSRGIADDQSYLPAKKVRQQKRQPVGLILGKAVLDSDVLALNEACFLQALAEPGRVMRQVSAAEKPHHRHRRLLRPRRERPRRRAPEQHDELAPFHSITLSARSTSPLGISWPIAFAVLRLMISSNLLGCSTGRSAGFVPRRSLASCRLMASRHKGTISGP